MTDSQRFKAFIVSCRIAPDTFRGWHDTSGLPFIFFTRQINIDRNGEKMKSDRRRDCKKMLQVDLGTQTKVLLCLQCQTHTRMLHCVFCCCDDPNPTTSLSLCVLTSIMCWCTRAFLWTVPQYLWQVTDSFRCPSSFLYSGVCVSMTFHDPVKLKFGYPDTLKLRFSLLVLPCTCFKIPS